MINQTLKKHLPLIAPSKNPNYVIDTEYELFALASKANCISENEVSINFFSKKIEITGRLYKSYDLEGRKRVNELISNKYQIIAFLLIFKDFLYQFENRKFNIALKRLNAFYKFNDHINADDKNKDKLPKQLDNFINQQINKFINLFTPQRNPINEVFNDFHGINTFSETLPVTVLFWESPISRAYLSTIKSMGLKPKKIIHLVSKIDLADKKPLGRFLPSFFRLPYAEINHKNRMHFWPKRLKSRERELYKSIIQPISEKLQFNKKTINEALALNDLKDYSNNYEKVLVNKLSDDRLLDVLLNYKDSNILFTGGGIVPKNFLDIPDSKFIHIHPGFLPEIRGADCTLWSHLIKSQTSATCFYMAPGIDNGDIIDSCYLPEIRFNYDIANKERRTLYRAIYSFFDPWVRAYALRRTIVKTKGFRQVNALKQNEKDSETYHFMHKKIQEIVFLKLFKVSGDKQVVRLGFD